MDTATFILVIILSVFLAIFLFLGVVLLIYLIRLTKEIRKVTDTAQRTVNHIETVVSGLSKLATPVVIADIVGNYVRKFTDGFGKTSKHKKGEDE